MKSIVFISFLDFDRKRVLDSFEDFIKIYHFIQHFIYRGSKEISLPLIIICNI